MGDCAIGSRDWRPGRRRGRLGGLIGSILATLLQFACRAPTAPPPAAAAPPDLALPGPRLEVHWDPRTGRGDLRHFLDGGDLLRSCFHCDYPGYTGGLVIGGFNGSGMGFYPSRPIRGFASINVFCAQDESIFDRDEQREYSYGWSENFGRGDDGERLAYVRGRVIEGGPAQVVLQSENAIGCYRVTKVVTARAGARHVIVATRIANRCARPLRFDLFTGDDPWIGRYRSAEGDVGWSPAGLHEREAALVAFTEGGLYDLGGGEARGSAAFSAQANFFRLDPAVPLPDQALLARRFAHRPEEVDPRRPLDDQGMIALNLGWTDRRLAPGEGFTIAMALGLATVAAPGALPEAPAIAEEEWSLWRAHLRELRREPDDDGVTFAAEEVHLTLTEDHLAVEGRYLLRSRGPGAMRIRFPIAVAPDRPPPPEVLVDGRTVPVTASGAVAVADFPVLLGRSGLTGFTVAYRQPHRRRHAVYVVTSAREWGAPLGRAVFEVRWPARWGRIRLSHSPLRVRPDGDQLVATIVRHDFVPDRELEARW